MLDFGLGKKTMLTFVVCLFGFFFFSLNLRGHKESAEEEVLYSSQPAEGKCHFLQLSQLHLLISQFKFIQYRVFLFQVACKEGLIFFFKATSFSVSNYLQSPDLYNSQNSKKECIQPTFNFQQLLLQLGIWLVGYCAVTDPSYFAQFLEKM